MKYHIIDNYLTFLNMKKRGLIRLCVQPWNIIIKFSSIRKNGLQTSIWL